MGNLHDKSAPNLADFGVDFPAENNEASKIKIKTQRTSPGTPVAMLPWFPTSLFKPSSPTMTRRPKLSLLEAGCTETRRELGKQCHARG